VVAARARATYYVHIPTGGTRLVKKRRRTAKFKGIARIDDPGKHGVGWYARVTFKGKTHSKYFADGAHGGKAKAFAKALEWRDAKEREVGKPRTDRVIQASRGRSSTGVMGVYRSRDSYVVAWTPEPGVLRREFVNIHTYGKAEALRRAVELRRKRERSTYGRALTGVQKTKKR
jgi:hypothetical protein